MAHKGDENLIPFTERTEEEQREIAIQGGIASGKARKEKKLIRDNIELLLSLPVKDEKIIERLKEQGIENSEEITNQMALVLALYRKAMSGDVNAFNSLRDTIGQGVTNKISVEKAPTILDDIK